MHLNNTCIGIGGGIRAQNITLLNLWINAPNAALKLTIKSTVLALQQNALPNANPTDITLIHLKNSFHLVTATQGKDSISTGTLSWAGKNFKHRAAEWSNELAIRQLDALPLQLSLGLAQFLLDGQLLDFADIKVFS